MFEGIANNIISNDSGDTKVAVKVRRILHYRPPSEGWGKVIFSVCPHLPWGGGGTTSQVWVGGYPISGLGRGGPGGGGGTPSQVQVGGYPIPGPGRGGTPSQVQVGGYPIPGPGRGVPVVPPPGIASTCYGYAAGGMPLAFTQEDFLVIKIITEKMRGIFIQIFHFLLYCLSFVGSTELIIFQMNIS